MTIETKQNHRLSFYTATVIVVLIFVMHFWNRYYNYSNFSNMIGWDVLSYYLYLPFTFIYHDIGMKDHEVIKYIFDNYHPSGTFYQAYKLDTGNWVPAYTMGFAILYLPFFLIAHLWAYFSSYPADGFSYPYQFCLENGVMLYILPGIFLVRKILLKFFNDKVTTLTLITILLGTNFWHESINDSLMPHGVMFTAFALFLLLLMNWLENPSNRNSLSLGLLTGITLLARGSEVVLIFLVLFWGVQNKNDMVNRFRFFLVKWKMVLLVLLGIFLVFLPQIIHWKLMTGHFIFNSYKNTEGVDWANPNLGKVLFSFKKSLLIYTPVYALMFFGILLMRKRMPYYFLAMFTFFIGNLYLLSCWAAWWNGYSFGMRYFVESYSLMVIPIACFIEWLLERKVLLKVFLFPLIAFLIFLNLFQTWQYMHYIWDGERMTAKYYIATFLKTKVPEGAEKLMEIKRNYGETEEFSNPQDYDKRTIAYYDFDSINSSIIDPIFLDSSVHFSGTYSCKLDANHIYSPTFRLPFNVLTNSDHAWVRTSLHYFPVFDLKKNPASLVVQMSRAGKGGRETNKYRVVDLDALPYKVGEWNEITFDYLTPYPLSYKDQLTVYVWHRGQQAFYYDNLKIDAFTPKVQN
ncbi:hypothetical protein BH11BAC2_BH11BAC2_10680 [soil metagenome]